MTIAIQGDWGTGKTSFINIICDDLMNQQTSSYNTLCYKFNTWQFSQFSLDNQLPIILISALVRELTGNSCTDTTFKKICSGLIRVASVGNELVKNQTGADVATLLIGCEENKSVIDIILELKSEFKNCVDNALKKNKGKEKVVIFIDDLDRLEPRIAVEILEILKLFLDCENCVFVLAIDYQVVNIGVTQKYGNLFNDDEKSKNFFDKIIQVPYKMPVAHYKIDKYVEKVLMDMKFSVDRVEDYKNLIAKSIGYNPRGMKRVFNAFLLLSYIYPDENLNEDEPKCLMLFASLCLQLSFEDVYNYIVSNEDSEQVAEILNNMLNDELEDDVFFTKLKDKSKTEQDNYYAKVTDYLDIFIKILSDDSQDITSEQVEKLFGVFKIAATTSSISSSRKSIVASPSNMLGNILDVLRDVRENKNENMILPQKVTNAFKSVAEKKGITSPSVSSSFTKGKLKLLNKTDVDVKIKELFDAFDNDGDYTQCELYKKIIMNYPPAEDRKEVFEEIKAL